MQVLKNNKSKMDFEIDRVDHIQFCLTTESSTVLLIWLSPPFLVFFCLHITHVDFEN